MNWSPARTDAALAAGAVLAGAVFGLCVALLNSGLTGVWRVPGIVLESPAAWCALPFVAGAVAAGRARACIAGLLVEFGAIFAYYYAGQQIGFDSSPNGVGREVLYLAPAGLGAGLLFGLAGRAAISASDGGRKHLWRMAIPAVLAVVAGGYFWLAGPDHISNYVSIAEFVLSCLALAYFALAFVMDRRATRTV